MMPREQPCSDETGSPDSSTKNAEDKNKSLAMQASHGSADNSNRRSSSEKDSGYSDTSSSSTNAKERSNKKSRETADESPLNQNEPHKNSNHGNATVAPSTTQIPSFYIIKNMVLEQPHIVQKNGQLLWSGGARSNVPGSNPLLLLQPPNILPPALQPRAPVLCKSSTTETMKDKAAYLPILNSYPRIAPHPNKKPPDKTAPTAESLNQSKRVCMESSNTQDDKSSQEQHIHKSNIATSSSSATVSTTQRTSSTELNKTSVINTRHRRFVNTMQALKQSGLLDVALRTKKLMCQSSVTGRDVAQLRQHSDLLCQLASGSAQNPSNMAALLNLHRIMADSGSYSDLKDVQDLQVPTTSQNVSHIKPPSVNGEGDGDGSLGASNTSEPAPKQSKRTRESESETLVHKDASPDSLTNK